MSFQDPLSSPNANLERVLWEARLRIRQGRFAEARERLEKARELAPEESVAVIELEGDLAFAQGRFLSAEGLYKHAFTLSPDNAKLEEKYATALLKMHEPELLPLKKLDDSPWSNRVPRNPIMSAIQSLLLPGLGQLHNGEWLKALIMMGIAIFILLAQLRTYIYAFYALRDQGSLSPASLAFAELYRGAGIALIICYVLLWLYSIADAAIIARETK